MPGSILVVINQDGKIFYWEIYTSKSQEKGNKDDIKTQSGPTAFIKLNSSSDFSTRLNGQMAIVDKITFAGKLNHKVYPMDKFVLLSSCDMGQRTKVPVPYKDGKLIISAKLINNLCTGDNTRIKLYNKANPEKTLASFSVTSLTDNQKELLKGQDVLWKQDNPELSLQARAVLLKLYADTTMRKRVLTSDIYSWLKSEKH